MPFRPDIHVCFCQDIDVVVVSMATHLARQQLLSPTPTPSPTTISAKVANNEMKSTSFVAMDTTDKLAGSRTWIRAI
jgi:hypothetical protein